MKKIAGLILALLAAACPALAASGGYTFIDRGHLVTVAATTPALRAKLPDGKYIVEIDGGRPQLVPLDAGGYRLAFDPPTFQGAAPSVTSVTNGANGNFTCSTTNLIVTCDVTNTPTFVSATITGASPLTMTAGTGSVFLATAAGGSSTANLLFTTTDAGCTGVRPAFAFVSAAAGTGTYVACSGKLYALQGVQVSNGPLSLLGVNNDINDQGNLNLTGATAKAGQLNTGGAVTKVYSAGDINMGGGGHLNQDVTGGFAGTCNIAAAASTCTLDLGQPFYVQPICDVRQQNTGTVTIQTVIPVCAEANTTSTTLTVVGAKTAITLVSTTGFNVTGTQTLCVDVSPKNECNSGTFAGAVFTPTVNWAFAHLAAGYQIQGARITVTLSAVDVTNTSTYGVTVWGNPN